MVPAHGEEGEKEEDAGDGSAGDEGWLEYTRANVGDEGESVGGFLRGVVGTPLGEVDYKHGPEHGCGNC